MLEVILASLILFGEPGFPALDVATPLVEIPGATVVVSVEELEKALEPDPSGRRPEKTLVWRHGSTFPAEAWPAFLRFLEAGGSFVYLGGEPFTRPVVGAAGKRVVQPRTVSLLKQLRLNQCYRVRVPDGSVLRSLDESDAHELLIRGEGWASVLEPRLSDTKDFASEDGAPGSRDAIVRGLTHVFVPGDERFAAAAGSFVIDRLRGRFAGGCWGFCSLSTRPEAWVLEQVVNASARAASDFRVDPTYGCYHAGEAPTVIVRAHLPRATEAREIPVTLQVDGPAGPRAERTPLQRATLRGAEHFSASVPLDMAGAVPGLYRVTLRAEGERPVTTGFWIFDPELFASGDDLTFDGYTMRRNGAPEPVLGSTVMSHTVHRKFLFEPNAAVWDDTFAELSASGFNMVRTGIWSAYRKISLDPHVVDEAWLRALEAYYLSARRHGIPVLFTFFAFVPETFGGDNPYFDPRAIEGQKAYLSAVAARFVGAKEMLWDLINEPSFSSPDHLWLCRPHGDAHEAAAFRAWLEARYSSSEHSWEDTVRARWRLRPDEAIGLPAASDFTDLQVFGEHRPYRARDYSHFAQDAFAHWSETMTSAIRAVGSGAAITVGQDEGGLMDRPSPLYHADRVAFTSIHTWWFNDALLWDGLMAKASGKPLLASETGIMQRELLSGTALRGPDEFARLLSRKLGLAFAAGAFGMIEWCYDVNPYMASDNEVAIGLRRVDGSYKPEHRVMRQFAGFLQRNRQYFENPKDPEVVLFFPSGDHYSPRGLQAEGTQRAVSLLSRAMGLPVQVVPEYRAESLGTPRWIVLPACRGLSDEGWAAIERAVEGGSVLLCSGWFEANDVGHAARRLGSTKRLLATIETHDDGRLRDGTGRAGELHYSRAVTESAYAATSESFLVTTKRGQGVIVHSPVPLEWAPINQWQRLAYGLAAEQAGIAVNPIATVPGIVIRTFEFERATLLIAVNESSTSRAVSLRTFFDTDGKRYHTFQVPAGETRMVLFDSNRKWIDASH